MIEVGNKVHLILQIKDLEWYKVKQHFREKNIKENKRKQNLLL